MPEEKYRECASMVVFRMAGGIREVLLLHKPRKKDAWQLPQGGVEEGETLEEAAKRELREEASLDVEILGRSSTVYEYDFPTSYRRFRPDDVRGQRLHFLFSELRDEQTVQVDGKEIDDHVWVKVSEIARYIGRPAYRDTVVRILEEGEQLLHSPAKP